MRVGEGAKTLIVAAITACHQPMACGSQPSASVSAGLQVPKHTHLDGEPLLSCSSGASQVLEADLSSETHRKVN